MDGDAHLHWHGSKLELGSNYLSVIVKYKPEPNGYILTMGCRNDLH